MPTFHRPDLIRRCLQALLQQTVGQSAFEIVVVDDGHSDTTQRVVEEIAAGLPRHTLRYLRPQQGRGPSVARNCGWRAANAPLVAFTDDDTVPEPGWLAAGEAAMRRSPCVAMGGRVAVPRPPGPPQLPTDHELMTRGLEDAEFVTANAFVRRNALQQVQGFDERFERAWREDSDLQFRLQHQAGQVGRCEDAVVVHPVRAERWGVSLRQQKNVFFDVLLYRKHPRLYRQRVLPTPPWAYYATVLLVAAALVLLVADVVGSAAVCLAIALLLVLRFATQRLRRTARTPEHVVEMLATSALIPFLSVYWRLRGAWHFRVWYL